MLCIHLICDMMIVNGLIACI